MTTLAWHFLNNTFDVQTKGTNVKMLSLATDTHAKLNHEIADPVINAIFNDFDPFYNAYRQICINYDLAAGNYEGETLSFENILDSIPTEVRKWESGVRAVYVEDSPQERAIFPNKRTPFLTSTYEERISNIGTLMEKLAIDPALAAVHIQVQNFYNMALSARLAQQGEEGGLAQLSDLRENQREITAVEMYGVLGRLMHKFRYDIDQVERFFDLELLRNPGSGNGSTPVLQLIKGTIVYVLGTPFVIGLGGENGEQVVIKPGDGRSIPVEFHGNAVDFENIDYAAAGTYNYTVEGKTSAVREIHINDAQMSSFSLPDDMPILTEVIMQNCNLDQTSVNGMVIVLAKNAVIGGVFNIIGVNNAVPDMSNPEVAAAISQLQARNWTILTN